MEESVGVGLSDLQLTGFVEHFANFRDRFVVIGGCAGRVVRSKDLLKHRNVVYHQATLLDGTFSTALPDAVRADLGSFLSLFAFEEKPTEWEGILAHLAEYDVLADAVNQESLTSSIVSYFEA